jgi:biopolymer transport protein ExbD
MKLTRPRQREQGENVIPLINVVFLLLIFFMIAGKLSEPAPFAVDPPRSEATRPAGPRPITVHVAADGRVAVNTETTTLAALGERLAAAEGLAEAPVRLKADGQADSHRVMAVMDALRAAGASEVVLLTLPAAGG